MLQQEHNNWKCKNTNFIDRGLAYQNLPPLGILPIFNFSERLLGTDINTSCQNSVTGRFFGPRAKNIYWKIWKKLCFLWFHLIIWDILGGFHSWTFFYLSLRFWVTGQIRCKNINISDFRVTLRAWYTFFYCSCGDILTIFEPR